MHWSSKVCVSTLKSHELYLSAAQHLISCRLGRSEFDGNAKPPISFYGRFIKAPSRKASSPPKYALVALLLQLEFMMTIMMPAEISFHAGSKFLIPLNVYAMLRGRPFSSAMHTGDSRFRLARLLLATKTRHPQTELVMHDRMIDSEGITKPVIRK